MPSARDERDVPDCILVLFVAERVTARRVGLALCWAMDVATRAVLFLFDVAARAVVVPDVVLRCDTLRVGVAFVAARAVRVLVAFVAPRADTDVPVVAARGAADVVVARRAVAVLLVVALRETTLRVFDEFVFLVRANTFICAFDCDGVTPGFRLVRMVLFIYGYKLLYVFSLT